MAPNSWFDASVDRIRDPDFRFWPLWLLAVTVGDAAVDLLVSGGSLPRVAAFLAFAVACTTALELARRPAISRVSWPLIVLLGIAGALANDAMEATLGVTSLTAASIAGLGLVLVSAAWLLSEASLSLSIAAAAGRETLYWATMLMVFAFGAAAGDVIAEFAALGEAGGVALLVFILVAATLACRYRRIDGLVAFWLVFAATRPLVEPIEAVMALPGAIGGWQVGPALVYVSIGAAVVAVLAQPPIRRSGDDAAGQSEASGMLRKTA